MADGLLYHLSLNEDRKETIVFLHGLTGSYKGWLDVAKHLDAYHVLLCDMPGHSRSRSLGPWTRKSTVEHVARLIKAKAHGGKCHIVGFSAGGFAAYDLARTHPLLVETVLLSGVRDFWAQYGFLTYLPPFISAASSALPQAVKAKFQGKWRLSAPDGADQDERENSRFGLEYHAWKDLRHADLSHPLAARTALVCAAEHDCPEQTRTLGATLRKGNAASTMLILYGACHQWMAQQPDGPGLCATAIDCWIRHVQMPAEFEQVRF